MVAPLAQGNFDAIYKKIFGIAKDLKFKQFPFKLRLDFKRPKMQLYTRLWLWQPRFLGALIIPSGSSQLMRTSMLPTLIR